MQRLNTYNKYREFGKDYLCRTTEWRHNKKRKLESENEVRQNMRLYLLSF